MDESLTIAMLGWKAQATTRHTLESWARSGLFRCGDEFFLFFNQLSEADRALAAEFGVDCRGVAENLGIWGGRRAIAREAKGEYLLFLDDDHEAVADAADTKRWIDASLDLLKRGRADIVILIDRFRRVTSWGDNHYFDYHPVRELDPRAARGVVACPKDWNRDTLWRRLHRLFRPFAARRRIVGAGPYMEAHPERLWPQYVTKEEPFFILDSAIQPFCDAPVMMSRAFYHRLCEWGEAHPRHRTVLGFQELETVLNGRWWRKGHFRTAICDGGVFGHRRVDDSWRRTNPGYNPKLVAKGRRP